MSRMNNRDRVKPRRGGAGLLIAFSLLTVTAAAAAPAAVAPAAIINAVGAENQYADVIGQIGGRYVHVIAIESDPNTDPHEFEISPKIAGAIAGAALLVENGLGYDDWADKIAAASPNPGRLVIDVQHLRGLPDDTPNPHLWYDPATMPAVAKAVAAGLTALAPAEAGYFAANETTFIASLRPWLDAVAAFKATFPNAPLAVTEPVADYMLQEAGAAIVTPFNLQAAIMNGTDPAPQDVAAQNDLLTGHKVKVLVYNEQVTDPLTNSFKTLARQNGVPLVAVYETMPIGYTYQGWMLAEVVALRRALTDKTSTASLPKETP